MIRINRGNPPSNFLKRSQSWKGGFEAAKKKDGKLTVSKYWSRIRVKMTEEASALAAAFHGKCAFCESYMAHVTSANIEHYRPKGNPEFEDLAFVWENWLFSCKRCNDKKWTHFPYCGSTPCLLDPTAEDPSEHLDFSKTLVLAKTERGQATISIIGLNRGPLEDERVRWLSYVQVLLLLCLIPATFEVAKKLLVWCIQVDAPYSAMTRAYLREKAPLLVQNDQSPIHFEEPISLIKELVEQHKDEIEKLM